MTNNLQTIRCFDLGGGGLKTALAVHDEKKGTMKLISHEIKLGRCPDNKEVSSWIREELKKNGATLDDEIKKGYRFGFSLAGVDKLRKKPVETGDIPKLFNLPKKNVTTMGDGSAHLLASVKTIKSLEGRIWNFSIGTGVGVACTNSKKEIRKSEEIQKFFDGHHGYEAKEPSTGKGLWEVCSSKGGFDKLLKENNNDKKKAFDKFAGRWKGFIQQEILDRSKKEGKEWGRPDCIVFTGGNIDYYGDELVKRLQNLPVKVVQGPKNAGILGAAWSTTMTRK